MKMVKKCERCGEEYDIKGGEVVGPNGEELAITEFCLSLSFKDMEGKSYFQDFDLCPDCLEEVFKVLDPTIETSTDDIKIKGGLN